MSTSVLITLIICITLIILTLISYANKRIEKPKLTVVPNTKKELYDWAKESEVE